MSTDAPPPKFTGLATADLPADTHTGRAARLCALDAEGTVWVYWPGGGSMSERGPHPHWYPLTAERWRQP